MFPSPAWLRCCWGADAAWQPAQTSWWQRRHRTDPCPGRLASWRGADAAIAWQPAYVTSTATARQHADLGADMIYFAVYLPLLSEHCIYRVTSHCRNLNC